MHIMQAFSNKAQGWVIVNNRDYEILMGDENSPEYARTLARVVSAGFYRDETGHTWGMFEDMRITA